MIEKNPPKSKRPPKRRVVVIGVGNILVSDEGVGVHVVNKLKGTSLPENVEVYECGTLGMRILNLLDKADKAVIIDAVKLGGKPGSVYRFKLSDIETEDKRLNMASSHELDLVTALKIAQLTKTYELPREIVVIGIEPKSIEYSLRLSPEVKKAMPAVVSLVLKEIVENSL